MDPLVNLKEQRELSAATLRIWDACSDDGVFTPDQLDELAHNAYRLAELVEALDTWRIRGGFDPYTVLAR